MRHLTSDIPLGDVTKNVGTMLWHNQATWPNQPAFASRTNAPTEGGDGFQRWTWQQLLDHILLFSAHLEKHLHLGSRVAIITPNSYLRLVAELAVMANGYTSVPIFPNYPTELLTALIDFSEVDLLILANCQQLKHFHPERLSVPIIVLEEPEDMTPYAEWASQITFLPKILEAPPLSAEEATRLKCHMESIEPTTILLIMYTSGTTNFPKGVQLTHYNILSQQAALKQLWKPTPGMRMLCYLPWHHSFGGLFERFFALHTGSCLALDDSFGKDIDRLFDNFKQIQPHVYFSVPKVYQEIISRVLTSEEAERIFFHPELRFVFTAAAPLPLSISKVFAEKKIPVVEGWGLTETSPCCTLTPPVLDRTPGVVGWPIPGVEIALAEDDEILVKGPNVMWGYFKEPTITAQVLDDEGWFKTGDIGELTDLGLKIVSRKDRVFKLLNGEKVYPSLLEDQLRSRCKYIKHAYVFGSGLPAPRALIFPNPELLHATATEREEGCAHPCDVNSLAGCLRYCLDEVNTSWKVRFERIQRALVINRELSLENNELTPSFKLVPRTVEKRYKRYIEALCEESAEPDLPEDAELVQPTPRKEGP